MGLYLFSLLKWDSDPKGENPDRHGCLSAAERMDARERPPSPPIILCRLRRPNKKLSGLPRPRDGVLLFRQKYPKPSAPTSAPHTIHVVYGVGSPQVEGKMGLLIKLAHFIKRCGALAGDSLLPFFSSTLGATKVAGKTMQGAMYRCREDQGP